MSGGATHHGLLRQLEIAAALFRLGLAEAVAYRASMVVWVLSTSFPLVALALWLSIAGEDRIGDFDRGDFITYFVAAFLVRQLTSAWVVWDLDHQIRSGDLSPLLLRPHHPVLTHAASNLAAIPVRSVVAAPVAIVVLAATGAQSWRGAPWQLAMVPLALILAWCLNFFGQLIVGSLAFWLTSASSLYGIWMGTYMVLSGYSVPTSLFPGQMREVVRVLPFHASLGFPVELIAGRLSPDEIWRGFAVQALWVGLFAALAAWTWRKGIRVYGAVGA